MESVASRKAEYRSKSTYMHMCTYTPGESVASRKAEYRSKSTLAASLGLQVAASLGLGSRSRSGLVGRPGKEYPGVRVRVRLGPGLGLVRRLTETYLCVRLTVYSAARLVDLR